MVKKAWKPALFVLSNLLLLSVLFISTFLYSSFIKWVPWYVKGGDALAFLAIWFLLDPILLVCGIALLVLGGYFPISILNKLIPFIAIAGISFPVLSVGGSNVPLIIGSSVSAALFLLTIALTVTNFTWHRRQS